MNRITAILWAIAVVDVVQLISAVVRVASIKQALANGSSYLHMALGVVLLIVVATAAHTLKPWFVSAASVIAILAVASGFSWILSDLGAINIFGLISGIVAGIGAMIVVIMFPKGQRAPIRARLQC